jgi:hypothetical protein
MPKKGKPAKKAKAKATTKGKSTLTSDMGQIVGHGAGPHPTYGPAGFLSLFFVRTGTEWVVCMSEGTGAYDWKAARKGLGADIPGNQFAPFAQRGLGVSVPYDQFRKLMEESFPGMKFEWVAEEKSNG